MSKTKRNGKDETVRRVKSDSKPPLSSCWYEGMNHMQLYRELSLESSGNVFPHGPQQRKQKRAH